MRHPLLFSEDELAVATVMIVAMLIVFFVGAAVCCLIWNLITKAP